ncbi:MAG: helix-turn-helix domain-containing protein [Chloroflexota bacterium]
MIQLQYELPAALQQEGRRFWILEEPQFEFNSDAIMPDSHTELVINCGAPMDVVADDGSRTRTPDAFLNRLLQKPIRLYALDMPQFVTVRLYPWVARMFIDPQIDLSSGSNIISLNHFWQQAAKTVSHVFHQRGHDEAVAYLTQALLDTPRQKADLTAIHAAGERLYEARGHLRIGDLAADSYLSVSQFERRFKHLTGVSAKTYARLVRFEAIRDYLWMYPTIRMADVVNDFGFTDQAHLIHEFKALTASTPGEYAAFIQRHSAIIKHAQNLQYT